MELRRSWPVYYKEIPKNILEKLQKPIESFTEESITRRLKDLFAGKWRSEHNHKQLFAISLPMIGPRGMEILTTIPLWLIENTITITLAKDDEISRTSYVICPVFDEESKKENEKLAFINTAIRGYSVGVDEKKLATISLEKDIIGRRLFFSERINDYIFDVEAMKVVLLKEKAEVKAQAEEQSDSDRRVAPRKAVPLFQGIPAMVTVDHRVFEAEIFILDFSSSGLKIISTYDFPQGKPFTLTLDKSEPIGLWCEVVWKNALWEQLQHVGLKFVKLHLDKFERLCRYLETLMPKKVEGDIRVGKMLPVEMDLWSPPKKMPTFFHSISIKELKIIHPSFLQEGTRTIIRIFPVWNVPPLECEVEVVSSQVLKEGGCLAILAVRTISDQNKEVLQGLLQKCALEERHSKSG
jgi:hypothetical protein